MNAAMETGETVHFSQLLLQSVVLVGAFRTLHLAGTCMGSMRNRRKKKKKRQHMRAART